MWIYTGFEWWQSLSGLRPILDNLKLSDHAVQHISHSMVGSIAYTCTCVVNGFSFVSSATWLENIGCELNATCTHSFGYKISLQILYYPSKVEDSCSKCHSYRSKRNISGEFNDCVPVTFTKYLYKNDQMIRTFFIPRKKCKSNTWRELLCVCTPNSLICAVSRYCWCTQNTHNWVSWSESTCHTKNGHCICPCN